MRLSQLVTRQWKTCEVVVIIAAAVGSLPLLFVIWFTCGDRIDNFLHQQSFDSKSWKKQESFEYYDNWPPRLCMVDDLLASGRLEGMTESQVIELLGPPGSRDEGKHLGFSYYLGPERGFVRIDSESLVIEFDKEGKVRDSRIHRD